MIAFVKMEGARPSLPSAFGPSAAALTCSSPHFRPQARTTSSSTTCARRACASSACCLRSMPRWSVRSPHACAAACCCEFGRLTVSRPAPSSRRATATRSSRTTTSSPSSRRRCPRCTSRVCASSVLVARSLTLAIAATPLPSLSKRGRLPQYSTWDDAVELIQKSQRIIVLSGAGISVSCGIPGECRPGESSSGASDADLLCPPSRPRLPQRRRPVRQAAGRGPVRAR